MRRAREEQQKRWSERAAADAEELAHKKRQEKLKKAREARKKNASSFGNGGTPLVRISPRIAVVTVSVLGTACDVCVHRWAVEFWRWWGSCTHYRWAVGALWQARRRLTLGCMLAGVGGDSGVPTPPVHLGACVCCAKWCLSPHHRVASSIANGFRALLGQLP